MGYPAFSYYPRRSPSNLKTVSFSRGWSLFECQSAIVRALAITHGRNSFAVVHGAYTTIEIETTPFSPSEDPTFFAQVWAWQSHALAGGIFSVAFDASLVSATTVGTQTAHNSTAIHVASTTGFAAGQWVAFEDVDDPTIHCRSLIASITDGDDLVINSEIGQVFNVGSVMRQAEYFPICRLMEVMTPFKEQKSDDGGGFKFKGTIEAVRS